MTWLDVQTNRYWPLCVGRLRCIQVCNLPTMGRPTPAPIYHSIHQSCGVGGLPQVNRSYQLWVIGKHCYKETGVKALASWLNRNWYKQYDVPCLSEGMSIMCLVF